VMLSRRYTTAGGVFICRQIYTLLMRIVKVEVR